MISPELHVALCPKASAGNFTLRMEIGVSIVAFVGSRCSIDLLIRGRGRGGDGIVFRPCAPPLDQCITTLLSAFSSIAVLSIENLPDIDLALAGPISAFSSKCVAQRVIC